MKILPLQAFENLWFTLIEVKMNKMRMIVLACMVALASAGWAQTSVRAQREIAHDPRLAAGKYLAYEAPTQPLTPAPDGYIPCYISTYARHGSRYLTGEDKYKPALDLLNEAARCKGLTPVGQRVLSVLTSLAEACGDRYGELTPKGVEQHRGLARRMFVNYPEIFVDGAHVDARSTYKTRAFLSMTAACVELKGLNPRLNVTADASEHDAYYLKYKNPIYSDSCQANADSVFAVARSRFVHPDRMMRQLFTKAYVSQVKDPQQLMIDLFEYHGISQSSYGQPDLSFLFTEDELYELWQLNNFEWYYEQGPSPLSGGHMPWLACNLLRNIVETADTALCSARPSASLRFGHDTNLAPLVSLMQIETFDKATAAWDSIPEYYQTYRIIPMCGNIQLVFYRKAGSSDVLVKPLLNEREVRLVNVATDQWPYYHWADVRRVWMQTVERIKLPSKPKGMKTD